jgi:hypothetical protein
MDCSRTAALKCYRLAASTRNMCGCCMCYRLPSHHQHITSIAYYEQYAPPAVASKLRVTCAYAQARRIKGRVRIYTGKVQSGVTCHHASFIDTLPVTNQRGLRSVGSLRLAIIQWQQVAFMWQDKYTRTILVYLAEILRPSNGRPTVDHFLWCT